MVAFCQIFVWYQAVNIWTKAGGLDICKVWVGQEGWFGGGRLPQKNIFTNSTNTADPTQFHQYSRSHTQPCCHISPILAILLLGGFRNRDSENIFSLLFPGLLNEARVHACGPIRNSHKTYLVWKMCEWLNSFVELCSNVSRLNRLNLYVFQENGENCEANTLGSFRADKKVTEWPITHWH